MKMASGGGQAVGESPPSKRSGLAKNWRVIPSIDRNTFAAVRRATVRPRATVHAADALARAGKPPMAPGVIIAGCFILRWLGVRRGMRRRFVSGGPLIADGKQLGPQHAHVARRVDAEPNDLALQVNHGDGNVITDLYLLRCFS
jgi:hypothetical protein